MDIKKKWIDTADDLIKRLHKSRYIGEWEFRQEPSKTWKKMAGRSWDKGKGDAYFRTKVVLPAAVEGLSLEHSAVELTFMFPSGVTVFIDDKKVAEYKYWAENRPAPYTLTENLKPGKKHQVTFMSPKGDGLGSFGAYLEYQKVEDAIFELESSIWQLEFAEFILQKNKNSKLRKVYQSALSKLDIEALGKRNWNKILSSIKNIEQALRPFSAYTKKFKVHLIGHAHIDMNWLWNYEDTIDTVLRDFQSVTNLMDEFPALTFSHPQAHTYKIAEEHNPKLFSKVKDKVKKGNWDITASTWVEGDLNMAAGEATVRQLMYASKYLKEKFGKEPLICWEPDTFGHPATIPQVLARSGKKYYYFMRCGKGFPIFWWQSPDGSRILAFNSVYNNQIRADNVITLARDFYNKNKIHNSMFVYGVGDHGGGPTRKDILNAQKLNNKPACPELIFSTTHQYFAQVLKEKQNFPVVKDELNFVFEGCYTTHADIKKLNREGENSLLTCEAISAFANQFGHPYPAQELEGAWQKVCFNQFHDIFDGSSIHSGYDIPHKWGREAIESAKKSTERALKAITKNIHIENKGIPLVVFNPLGWERDDVVEVDLPLNLPSNFSLWDGKKEIPHRLAEGKLIFVAPGVPAYGYKIFYLVKTGKKRKTEKKFVYQGGDIETSHFIAELDSATGMLTFLQDKKTKKDIICPPSSERSYWGDKESNLLQVLQERPHGMSAWYIGSIERIDNLLKAEKIEIEEENPLRTVVSIRRKYRKSKIKQKIIFYQNLPRIDFAADIDWREKGSSDKGSPMLRVVFHLNSWSKQSKFEIPFGSIERSSSGHEYPALRWADISGKDYGVSLLNDSKHGYFVDGNKICLTLLRNPYEPDRGPDTGRHSINYSLYPHQGKLDELDTTKKAAGFNQPLIGTFARPHSGKLPAEHSFLEFSSKTCIPSSLKLTNDDSNVVFRYYELKGKKGEAEIKCSFLPQKIYESDLMENKEKEVRKTGELIKSKYRPYQIKTILMKKT